MIIEDEKEVSRWGVGVLLMSSVEVNKVAIEFCNIEVIDDLDKSCSSLSSNRCTVG